MEEWQREHIKKNLVELIKLTTCNVHLIARLAAKNVLGKEDEEELELPNMTFSKKSKRLFEILVTRVGAYDHLVKSLEEIKQSGAVEVLKAHSVLFRCYGSISYDKNHVLGKGSSGTKVFNGVYDGRDVAVKVLNTDMISSALAIREVNILKRLDGHENVVRYFMAESQDNFIYIALELCVISLQDEVKMNLVNLDKVEILRQCTKGLTYLHKNKVIHGDLKPANILLNRHQKVKLSDFGIAKQIQTDRTSVSTANVGTLDYLAPEILKPVLEAEGVSVTVKMSNSADIFSLGSVLHFALTVGVHPFGTTPFQRHNRILQSQPNVSGDIEDRWKNVIQKMISSTPNDRPSVAMISTLFTEPTTTPKSETKVSSKSEETTRLVHQIPRTKTIKPVSESTPSTFEHARKMFENSHLTNEARMIKKPLERGSVVPAVPQGRQYTPPNDIKSKPAITSNPINLKQEPEVIKTDHLTEPKTTTPQEGHLVVPAKYQEFPESENSYNVKLSEQELIEMNTVDTNGNNALFRAVISGEPLTRIRHLVESGVEWKGENKEREMILHVAATRGQFEAIKYFVAQGADIHSRDIYNQTPLLISSFAEKNFIETVSVLIESGSDVKEVDWRGRNLVLLAVERGRTRSELEFLVKLGIPWNLTEKYWKRNVLHIAAEKGNVEALNYFISLGADVHARDTDGRTPLLFCAVYAEKNFKDIVSALVKAGSDVNAVDRDGNNLVFLAAEGGRSRDELEEIVKLGVPWKGKNKANKTVLHKALERGNVDAAKYFISLGADVNTKDTLGRAPLHYVCSAEKNFEEMVTLLTANGAQINATDIRGETLLDWISGKVRTEFVEKLGGVRRKT